MPDQAVPHTSHSHQSSFTIFVVPHFDQRRIRYAMTKPAGCTRPSCPNQALRRRAAAPGALLRPIARPTRARPIPTRANQTSATQIRLNCLCQLPRKTPSRAGEGRGGGRGAHGQRVARPRIVGGGGGRAGGGGLNPWDRFCAGFDTAGEVEFTPPKQEPSASGMVRVGSWLLVFP